MIEDTNMRIPAPHSKLLSDAAPCRTPVTPKSLLKSCLAFSVFNEACYQDPFKWGGDSISAELPQPSPSTRASKRRRTTRATFFEVSSTSPQVPSRSVDSPKVRLVKFGEKSLCFIQWKEGSQYFIYSEVIKVVFVDRARSSVNLRARLLGAPHTLVKQTDYTLARKLKSTGAVSQRSCSNLRLIEFTDLLRLITSFKYAPKLKTGHREDNMTSLHISQVDSEVMDLTDRDLEPMAKLRMLAKIINCNED
ncbi:uncharacterized protein LOC134826673 [Bolinopsis microptera]|uniref:uncharacterized protein LOC134826673 n=1 Tax=Bolinopsis microptera TaxID=2820187 RepID=UPI00307A92B8